MSPLPMPALCLFDLDGTLVHHDLDFFYPQFVRICSEMGMNYPNRDDFEASLRKQKLFAHMAEGERLQFELDFWDRFDKVGFPDAVMIEGVIETLEHFLIGKSKIAIITARTHLPDDVERCLQKTGILKYISVISTLGEPHLFKRIVDYAFKREQILYVCEKLGVSPKDCIIAGDSPSDITSGKAVGAAHTTGILGSVERELMEVAEPDLIVNSLSEIIPYFG